MVIPGILIQEDGLHSAPDLIIELLSPLMAKYDLHEKKDVYERSDVKEYWIVDPGNKEVLGYFLEKGSYGEPVNSIGRFHSLLLDHEVKFYHLSPTIIDRAPVLQYFRRYTCTGTCSLVIIQLGTFQINSCQFLARIDISF